MKCIYTSLRRRGGYTNLSLSVLPFETNIFGCAFLSSYASDPLQTWFDAFARGSTHRLTNSGLPVIYFLFYNLAFFSTLTNVFDCIFLSNHASQPLKTWYCALARGPSRRLHCFGLPFQISTSCFMT